MIYIVNQRQPIHSQIHHIIRAGGILQWRGERCIVAPRLLSGFSKTYCVVGRKSA